MWRETEIVDLDSYSTRFSPVLLIENVLLLWDEFSFLVAPRSEKVNA